MDYEISEIDYHVISDILVSTDMYLFSGLFLHSYLTPFKLKINSLSMIFAGQRSTTNEVRKKKYRHFATGVRTKGN